MPGIKLGICLGKLTNAGDVSGRWREYSAAPLNGAGVNGAIVNLIGSGCEQRRRDDMAMAGAKKVQKYWEERKVSCSE